MRKVLATLLAIAVLLSVASCHRMRRLKSPPRLKEAGLIDIHAHIGQFPGYNLSLENLLTNLHSNNVEYALISNIDGAAVPGASDKDEKTINEETARVCSEHRELKPIAWAKPGAKGASAELIEPFLRDKGFLGIKFHPDFNNFQANSPVVVPYMELCKKYGVPALFHCGRSTNSSAKVIYDIARKYPTVPVILMHMGFGTNHDEAIEIARKAKENGDALIYLETSQTDMASIQVALEQVGADRIVFGSDATYFGKNHYDFYIKVVDAVKFSVPPADFRKVIRGNALKLFKIEDKDGES